MVIENLKSKRVFLQIDMSFSLFFRLEGGCAGRVWAVYLKHGCRSVRKDGGKLSLSYVTNRHNF